MKPVIGLRVGSAVVTLLAVLLSSASVPLDATAHDPQYYSPLPDTEYVSTGATIVVRYGPVLNEQSLAQLNFSVRGSRSGLHAGQTILADDHQTVIFKPTDPFIPGELVNVDLPGLIVGGQAAFTPLSYTFTVALHQKPGSVGSATTPPPANPPASAFPDFLTVPQDIPHFTLTRSAPSRGEGDLFMAPFYWTSSTVGSYLLILNDQGQLVYYQSLASELAGFDFKLQPNGELSYFDQRDSTYYLMDSHYQVTKSIQAGNGYTTDLHDLQVLPNGNALLMVYDTETVDMSQVVRAGKKDASVTGLVIQGLDPSGNVIFEWRSWDHFSFSDTSVDLTAQQIDLVHGNALALASDGNLLLSSRNLSEITKIDLKTGAVIWRLGGKANMFRFTKGAPFAYQHDVRQLPNGDITVFDNQGTPQDPTASQGIEYRIDEAHRTATVVWDYIHSPPVFTTFMGNNQRLLDGNILLSWGAPFIGKGFTYLTMTELTPGNQPIFELSFDKPYVSYRAFLAPWQGTPLTLPSLAYKISAGMTLLGYSWNGATQVAAYRLYGGSSALALNLIEEKVKTDFEMQSRLSDLPQGECYFQVAALDQSGAEMARSRIISTHASLCPPVP